MSRKPKYQEFGKLSIEEYQSLEADILRRGVMVAIELDENGEILDGHNRKEIAERHSKPYKTIVRKFNTEQDKIEHVIKLNLCRRHLEPYKWGKAFKRLLEVKGVKRGAGTRNDKATSATVAEVAATMGVPERTAYDRMAAADQFDTLPKPIRAEIADEGKSLVVAVREQNAEQAKTEHKALAEVELPVGTYSTIVIDPPWPMKKIARDCRPNQVAMDYPIMTEGEIADIVLPAAKNCHLFLWTTHKFLPMALRVLSKWGFRYVCCMVWHKPGGFQPIGLPQYNCEFAVYARQGTPKFTETKAFNTCFSAPRGKHSEKPEGFYDIIRRVTSGRRIDMFGRREIKGFKSWGKESPQ